MESVLHRRTLLISSTGYKPVFAVLTVDAESKTLTGYGHAVKDGDRAVLSDFFRMNRQEQVTIAELSEVKHRDALGEWEDEFGKGLHFTARYKIVEQY